MRRSKGRGEARLRVRKIMSKQSMGKLDRTEIDKTEGRYNKDKSRTRTGEQGTRTKG